MQIYGHLKLAITLLDVMLCNNCITICSYEQLFSTY